MKPPPELEIIESQGAGRTAVLRLRGRLDATTVSTLLERCNALQGDGHNLVLNLGEITFLGSSGVGAMLVLVEQFGERAGAVLFAAPSEAVRSVVELLELGEHLSIYATEDEAVRATAA
ncbi:MAG TPA: STAS domain-containing protein [Candidatus Eisenbacteria bacterium]